MNDMDSPLDDIFLKQVNENLGIAHKVCRLYFADAMDREDVLQEMMYQLYKSYRSFDGRSKFSTWMYRVCLNTALTSRRRYKYRKAESLELEHHEIAEPASDNPDEAAASLWDAIAILSPLNKAIILLYLENLSYDEIANITGLTKSNVSVRLVRIKKELELELRKTIKSIEDVNP